MIRLIIFDVDGTLAKSHRLDLLPGVKEFFQLVINGGCEPRPKLAIATNQGGVGKRYGLESSHTIFHERYPTAEEIELRMSRLLEELGAASSDIPLYISYRYRDRQGKVSPLPPDKANDPRWRPDWRKPSPGMLLQAIADASVQPEEAMYVGDRNEDRQAAQAANCAFVWAKDFFNHDWQTCQSISTVLQTERANERTRTNQSSWFRRLAGR